MSLPYSGATPIYSKMYPRLGGAVQREPVYRIYDTTTCAGPTQANHLTQTHESNGASQPVQLTRRPRDD